MLLPLKEQTWKAVSYSYLETFAGNSPMKPVMCCGVCCCYFDLLFETISCGPGWPQTHEVAKDDQELLAFI